MAQTGWLVAGFHGLMGWLQFLQVSVVPAVTDREADCRLSQTGGLVAGCCHRLRWCGCRQ